MTSSKNPETGKPVVKVNIPPRRRTASIEVELDNGQTIKAAVNKAGVNLSTRTKSGYTERLSLPRNNGEVNRVVNLLLAAIAEMNEQDEYLSKSD